MNVESFAQLVMLAMKKNDETYVALSYQMLFIESSKKFANRETARCEVFQIKKSDVLKSFRNLAQMFSKMLLNNLNTYDQIEHSIDLVKKKTPRIDCVYNMSQDELAAFWNYIANALKKNWIRFFSEPIEASVLFMKKFNDNLRLCVDYRELNEIIIKNKYSLSFFLEILKRFAKARRFIKIDIRNVYHRIRIRKSDEWKIAFRIRYDQFEYQIMFFDFVNVSAIFQSYVNRAFKSYINVCCVIYLNDVLIYSKIEK